MHTHMRASTHADTHARTQACTYTCLFLNTRYKIALCVFCIQTPSLLIAASVACLAFRRASNILQVSALCADWSFHVSVTYKCSTATFKNIQVMCALENAEFDAFAYVCSKAMMLCWVLLGRIYISGAIAKLRRPPDGFDLVGISLTLSGSGSASIYAVFDNNQAIPEYIVHLEWDNSKQHLLACNTRHTLVWCVLGCKRSLFVVYSEYEQICW